VINVGYNVDTKENQISTEGGPPGDLASARAHWVARGTIVWDVVGSPKYSYALHYNPEGAVSLASGALSGGQRLPLSLTSAGPGNALQNFPHLLGLPTLRLAEADLTEVPEILRGQAVSP
jgi:hypothetical protein